MKKVILMILSLAMMFSGAIAVPVSAADFTIESGYKFVDIAHNGSTYVALAKNTALSSGKLYCSKDGGLTWTSVRSISGAEISANKPSQQQLVYWADKGVFVAHCASTTLTSADGTTWEANTNIHWTTNSYLTTMDKYLILAGGSSDSAVNVQDNLTTKQYADNKKQINANGYIPKAVAATPKDSNGDIRVFTIGSQYAYQVKMTPGTPYTWKVTDNNSGGIIPSMPYDMVYAKNANQFLSVDGTNGLMAYKDPKNFAKITVSDSAAVTGVNANDSYIVVGMSDGTMYYTANAEITTDTVWTEIPAQAGSTACSEPIKNIEFSGSNTFIALSETQVYTCDTTQYCNINEYVPQYLEIGEPTVAVGADPFEGVRLIGGTYSPSLNKYIVYGDTTTPDSDNKYWGKIFTSSNGFDWKNTYTGYTFSARTIKDGAITGYTEVRNGAVWWESQGIFIVSASTSDHIGYSLTSTDGETWTAVKGFADDGDEEGTVYTGLALNADIRIAGDYLYTTNGAHKLMKYTEWNKNAAVEVADVSTLEGMPAGLKNINQIAVSDEADPAVLMAQGYLGVVRDNTSTSETELGKWSVIRTYTNASYPNQLGIGNGDLTDAVYSKRLGKFVAVVAKNLRTVIIPKAITETDKAIQGPVVGGVVCNAIDTNGSAFMLTGKEGKIYTAPDSEEFKNGYDLTSNAVPAATADDEVTWGMTNVFATTGDQFIATSSNNTDSAVLVIDKNSNGSYEYKRAELNDNTSIIPGEPAAVSVEVKNQMPDAYEFTVIAAIFNENGTLAQVKLEDKTVSAYTNSKEEMTMDVASDISASSSMKIFLWNSADGMMPRKAAVTPF